MSSQANDPVIPPYHPLDGIHFRRCRKPRKWTPPLAVTVPIWDYQYSTTYDAHRVAGIPPHVVLSICALAHIAQAKSQEDLVDLVVQAARDYSITGKPVTLPFRIVVDEEL